MQLLSLGMTKFATSIFAQPMFPVFFVSMMYNSVFIACGNHSHNGIFRLGEAFELIMAVRLVKKWSLLSLPCKQVVPVQAIAHLPVKSNIQHIDDHEAAG